jgi:fatty acid desaturase
MLAKATKQAAKDYLLWLLLSGPSAVPALLVTHHHLPRSFPDGVEEFTEDQIEGETRAQWYLRQVQGSANIEGSPLFHMVSGNLSHQIEHHLFPGPTQQPLRRDRPQSSGGM